MILPFHSNVFTHENRKRTSSQKLAPFVPLLESSFRERGFEGDKGQSQISEIKKEKERTKLGSAFRLSTLTLWTADVQLHRCTPVFPPRWQAMSGEHTLESEDQLCGFACPVTAVQKSLELEQRICLGPATCRPTSRVCLCRSGNGFSQMLMPSLGGV